MGSMKKTPKKTVWIVDDDESILEVVQEVVKHAGYATMMIQDPQSLDEKFLTLPHPNVILLDVLMSGSDGRDVSQRIKSNPQTQHIPVIILSADTKLEEKAQQAHADDFLRKPFNIDELVAMIKKYV